MGGVILIGVVGDQILQRRAVRSARASVARSYLRARPGEEKAVNRGHRRGLTARRQLRVSWRSPRPVGPAAPADRRMMTNVSVFLSPRGEHEESRMSLRRTAVLICASVLVVTGCSRQPSSTKRLAFITNNAADFWTIARQGTEKADAELPDVAVEFRLGDGTAAEQKRIVDDLLAKGVDGIAISPVDPANQTAMLNDAAKQAHRLHARQRRAGQQARVLRRHRQRGGRPAGRRADQGGPAPGRHDRALRRQAGRAQRPGAAAGHQGGDRRLEHQDHRRAHGRHRSGPGEGERRRDAGRATRTSPRWSGCGATTGRRSSTRCAMRARSAR